MAQCDRTAWNAGMSTRGKPVGEMLGSVDSRVKLLMCFQKSKRMTQTFHSFIQARGMGPGGTGAATLPVPGDKAGFTLL